MRIPRLMLTESGGDSEGPVVAFHGLDDVEDGGGGGQGVDLAAVERRLCSRLLPTARFELRSDLCEEELA